MPNYPQMVVQEKYKGKIYCSEEIESLKIFRAWIFVTKSKSILLRLLNYFSFVFSSFWVGLVKLKKHDYLLCESPPLFLGISAYLLKKIKGSKLIFNVSDLWPESAEKLGLVKNKTVLAAATKLEEFLYKKSSLISGQTQGIVKNIQSRFPDKKITWLPNGVDLTYYNFENKTQSWKIKNGFKADDFILLYAGIIGHAQGLDVILKAAEKLQRYEKLKFILVGSGPEKERLLLLQKEKKLSNVLFYDAVTKAQMPEIVASCDASIIPLKKLDLFKGAIPSKLFEILAMKKPILLGVEGEAKDLFIEEGNCGLAFEPENENELCTAILNISEDKEMAIKLGENGYNYVKQKFTRDLIANNFYSFLLEHLHEQK
jgi:glycosyltransferase involved in cell wall biosynthesis